MYVYVCTYADVYMYVNMLYGVYCIYVCMLYLGKSWL